MNKAQFEQLFTYCPRCGQQHITFAEGKALHCSDCDFIFYINPAPTSTALLRNTQGQLLMVRRARDPQKGMWDLPGGFIDNNETVEQALQRELQEEVGVTADTLNYFGSWVNTYVYKDVPYMTLDLIFIADLSPDKEPRVADTHEITELQWFDPQQIVIEEVAFPSLQAALRNYMNVYEV